MSQDILICDLSKVNCGQEEPILKQLLEFAQRLSIASDAVAFACRSEQAWLAKANQDAGKWIVADALPVVHVEKFAFRELLAFAEGKVEAGDCRQVIALSYNGNFLDAVKHRFGRSTSVAVAPLSILRKHPQLEGLEHFDTTCMSRRQHLEKAPIPVNASTNGAPARPSHETKFEAQRSNARLDPPALSQSRRVMDGTTPATGSRPVHRSRVLEGVLKDAGVQVYADGRKAMYDAIDEQLDDDCAIRETGNSLKSLVANSRDRAEEILRKQVADSTTNVSLNQPWRGIQGLVLRLLINSGAAIGKDDKPVPRSSTSKLCEVVRLAPDWRVKADGELVFELITLTNDVSDRDIVPLAGMLFHCHHEGEEEEQVLMILKYLIDSGKVLEEERDGAWYYRAGSAVSTPMSVTGASRSA